jgi:hypothetical protein
MKIVGESFAGVATSATRVIELYPNAMVDSTSRLRTSSQQVGVGRASLETCLSYALTIIRSSITETLRSLSRQ